MRAAFQSLAAVLGGCQSINTDTLDEALGTPQEIGCELALRTQQIIAFETHVADTIDPLAGSYYVEYLTNEIEKRVLTDIRQIDELGGPLSALENGFFTKEAREAGIKYAKEVLEGKRIRIGVNKFVKEEEEQAFTPFRVSAHYEEIQIERVRNLRQERDSKRWQQAVDQLSDLASQQEKNVIPGIVEALKADATVGEISAILRKSYGPYLPHSRR